MTEFLDRLRELSRPTSAWYALAAALGLTALGIAAISTADLAHVPTTSNGTKQLLWLGIGMAAMLITASPRPRRVGLLSMGFFAIILLVLLVIVLPFMPRSIVPVINGTRAWINLYFMQFQPSELTKVAYVIALAWYLRYRESLRTFKGLAIPMAMTGIPILLILRQPDLGTAMLFVPVLFAMLLAAGAKLWHLSLFVFAGLGLVAVLVASIYLPIPEEAQFLRDYQRDRIHAMIMQTVFEDRRFVQDVGYQQDRSQLLIGAGGRHGYGLERSATILRFNQLPEDHNDMIFAVIVNRWGLAGGLMLMALYCLLIGSLLVAAVQSREAFTRLALVGFAALFFSQFVVNVGMASGLLPIIGITLPFVSYGGSSLMVSYMMIGLSLNFASYRPRYVMRESFEFNKTSSEENSG